MCKGIVKGEKVDIKLWTPTHEVETRALEQLERIAALPWTFHHVAVMPDVHYGKGATVGSVIAMKGAVSPAAVGVDIGCGMGAIKTNLKAHDLPDSLAGVRSLIESKIPVGFHSHDKAVLSRADLFREFGELDSRVQKLKDVALKQAGTLGGGNHFIELCLDTEDNVWMMLHSGSRRIGKELASIHIDIAKELAHNEGLPDKDLSVFLAGTSEMDAYRRDLYWAQRYAFLNRETMFSLYKEVMREVFPHVMFGDPIMCHHNYVAEESHFEEDVFVTRKGAISAEKGVLGIIPGSMGTKSYVVEGRGNPDSFNSASHGAGRKMSRTKAKKTFSLDDLREQTKGIECRKDAGVVDEIPAAYKSIDRVMENQKDLVKVVAELKQVLCVKG